jgi:hypothetical protein
LAFQQTDGPANIAGLFLPAREIFLSFCGCGIAELQMPPTGGACAEKRDPCLDGAARPIHFGVF